MKYLFIAFALFSGFTLKAGFSDCFIDKTLRVDYFHTGNFETEVYSIDEVLVEPYWGGSWKNLVDTLGYGEYLIRALDAGSRQVIYSHGFCALFDEWQFTIEAKTTFRTFTETFVMPYPKKDVVLEFYSRSLKGKMEKKFEYRVDVKNYFISDERRFVFPVYPTLSSGDPARKIDIVILPEGYTASEMERFKADCDKFAKGLFRYEPYSLNRDKFNITAVLAPSAESGTDIPGEGIRKSTILNSSFYTFDSERYLMTYDNKLVRDLAANAPYDQVYILVNSPKYGGGAIYNYYNVSVNSNASSDKIFVHEFGHGFAGLGDEYDEGSTTYNELYPLGIEPWEPNITTLVNFGEKWKSMLPPGTPVPTPARPGKPMELGVYEGAGYVAKGIYRPVPDCLMRSFAGNAFCPVCIRGIQKMIDFCTE